MTTEAQKIRLLILRNTTPSVIEQLTDDRHLSQAVGINIQFYGGGHLDTKSVADKLADCNPNSIDLVMLIVDSQERRNYPGLDGDYFLSLWTRALDPIPGLRCLPRVLWNTTPDRKLQYARDHYVQVWEGLLNFEETIKRLGDVRMLIRKRPSVFMSHSWSDKTFVRKLAADLRDIGIRVWLDEAEIRIGDSLIQKIREGIDQIDYVAVVLSEKSTQSEWVRREVDIAMNQEIEQKRVKVLPLVKDKCDLPWFLKGKAYADFSKESKYGESLAKLVDRILSG